MSIECLDKFVIYVARKTTSWISLILFPALLYCHLLNVELRHNVDGVPRQLCTLPTTPRFTCPHFPSLAFVPFPSASSNHWAGFWFCSLQHKETAMFRRFFMARFMWLKLEDAHHSLYRTRLDMEGRALTEPASARPMRLGAFLLADVFFFGRKPERRQFLP